MSKTKGLHTHRFRVNPEEKRFADAWAKCDGSGKNLDYHLDTRQEHCGEPPVVDDRDRVVAATIVQWLGSPVGQGFLRDLGYERSKQ